MQHTESGPSPPSRAAQVGALLWWVACVGCFAWLVGLIDLTAERSARGDLMRNVGLGLMVGPGLLSLGLDRRAGSMKRRVVAWLGVLPFAAFLLFFVWRFGVSKEQREGCAAGNAPACQALAERRLRRGHPEDARALADRGCAAGFAPSCELVGTLSRQGIGGPVDEAGAALALGAACDADRALACMLLGQLLRGEGAAESSRDAFDQACRLGLAAACEYLDDDRPAPEAP
jgi:hypothetical protein